MTKNELIHTMNQQVKLVRTEYGFTQEVMAQTLGLSKKTLVEIEKGRSSLGWTGTVAFCTLFSQSQVLAGLLGGFFLLRPVLDLSQLTGTLTASTGVDRQNFPLVALYISLVNSFLEESFFRGFAFLALASHTSARTACLFSAGAFALYHVAMTLGWFPLPLLMLVVAGLFLGGCFFNWCAWKSGSLCLLYTSPSPRDLSTSRMPSSA